MQLSPFSRYSLFLAGLLVVALPAAAWSQTTTATAEAIQLGPLGLTPTLSLTNIGVDNNVFRDETGPRSDFTATLSPGLGSSIQVGPMLVTGKTTVAWNYFQKAANQRSFDVSQDAKFTFLFSRLVPYFGGSYVTTRQRVNLEIDERVRRVTPIVLAGTTVVFSPLFALTLEGTQSKPEFSDRSFGDPLLAQQLNRRTRVARAEATIQATPITAVIVRGEWQDDVFSGSSLRNSQSEALSAGLSFSPSSLISGSGRVGFRRFEPADPSVPPVRLAIANANLSYVWGEMTKVAVSVARDVDFSYRETAPYFIGTQASLELTQVIGASWDVVARYGRNWVEYSGFRVTGLPSEALGPTERTFIYGVGVGHHLASGIRIGFNADKQFRLSGVDGRNYDGFRAGGSVTYGF